MFSEEEGLSDVVNIGGGRPSSMTDMIETLEFLLGEKVKSKINVSNPNDVTRTCADSRLLVSLIGTAPETSLKNGLSAVVSWAQRQDIAPRLNAWCESVT
jgi:UDP-glucuronate 4-epimerase